MLTSLKVQRTSCTHSQLRAASFIALKLFTVSECLHVNVLPLHTTNQHSSLLTVMSDSWQVQTRDHVEHDSLLIHTPHRCWRVITTG